MTNQPNRTEDGGMISALVLIFVLLACGWAIWQIFRFVIWLIP
jgi:hypothetical protein